MSDVPSTLRAAREETIDILCRHFAEEAYGLGELERRLEKARAARSRTELAALVVDLDTTTLPEASPRERNQPVPRGTVPKASGVSYPALDLNAKPQSGSFLAISVMGGTRRAGRWVSPGSMNAVAIMGGVEVDFRDAILTSEVTEVTCFAFWGGVEVTVPPDVNVETNGFALMGGFEQNDKVPTRPGDGAPTIRITGMALMGGVEVKVAERGDKV
jgi:hypothetical protein